MSCKVIGSLWFLPSLPGWGGCRTRLFASFRVFFFCSCLVASLHPSFLISFFYLSISVLSFFNILRCFQFLFFLFFFFYFFFSIIYYFVLVMCCFCLCSLIFSFCSFFFSFFSFIFISNTLLCFLFLNNITVVSYPMMSFSVFVLFFYLSLIFNVALILILNVCVCVSCMNFVSSFKRIQNVSATDCLSDLPRAKPLHVQQVILYFCRLIHAREDYFCQKAYMYSTFCLFLLPLNFFFFFFSF